MIMFPVKDIIDTYLQAAQSLTMASQLSLERSPSQTELVDKRRYSYYLRLS